MIKLKAINKVGIPAAGLTLMALALLAATALAAGVDVDGRYSLFGNAQYVVGGLRPGFHGADLTSTATTYSGVAFKLKPGRTVTLANITTLSAAYNVGATDCDGGSPRFSISLNTGKNIFVYFGPYPNFNNCLFGWQSTGNVIGTADLRWDSSQLGGPFYGTYSDALALAGTTPITEIDLVVDSGWNTAYFPRGEDVTVDNFTVNDNVGP